MVEGFRDTFTKGGGKVLKDITVPFPNVEFQAALAEIASLKPDAVYSFFAGGGAVKFIKDYAGANLQSSIPLWGPGFLTDGVEQAVGAPATASRPCCITRTISTIRRTRRSAPRSTRPIRSIRTSMRCRAGTPCSCWKSASRRVGGDVAKRDELCAAMSKASFKSPRGPFRLSASHNPIQNFYLRELKDGNNVLVKTVATEFPDLTTGCKLSV